MSVTVTKTSGFAAEITWTPEDDPTGYLAKAVESDQLAYALEAVGDGDIAKSEDQALLAAQHTTALARLLERRAAVQVVQLRDSYGMSWRRIAGIVLDNPERQSAVRRMYDSGRRHIGI
ncbi:hypothetical protein [Streptomyces sp. IBSBF 3010]|uniref:hypothetical protein n=1 Tax=unclassified Streptomyces TaxID=2593676 RepID=UPI002FDC07B3